MIAIPIARAEILSRGLTFRLYDLAQHGEQGSGQNWHAPPRAPNLSSVRLARCRR
jgi:hypothetical protein